MLQRLILGVGLLLSAETTQAALREAYARSGSDFINALLMSAVGLIGIFVVIGVIALMVTVLNKIGRKKDKKPKPPKDAA